MKDWLLPTIDMDLCTSCGLCVQYCPTSAVEMLNARPIIVRSQDCSYCGKCEEICPVGAIALIYEIVSPQSAQASE